MDYSVYDSVDNRSLPELPGSQVPDDLVLQSIVTAEWRKMFTIGVLSRRARVKIETIRYYERIGLVPKPGRTESGRRLYGSADVKQLSFIRHARELGFDIASIRAMLGLREIPDASCEDVSRIAQDQLVAVNDRISRLLGLRQELSRMIGSCANGKIADCRIIEVLADHNSPTDLAEQKST